MSTSTAGGLIGAFGFLLIFGLSPLNPTNLDWLFYDDRTQHVTGWMFFRDDVWRWPLGWTDRLLVPHGGSIALTDSIPLLAIWFKLIAGSLPHPFQYSGLWVLFSYVFIGATASRLAAALGASVGASLIAAGAAALSPVLAGRSNHVALMGQWLVLAAILTVVGYRSVPLSRVVVLNVVASLVHPYLYAIVFALTIAWAHAAARQRPRWQALLTVGLSLAGPVCLFGLLGYFAYSGYPTYGFRVFTADVTSLVNPQGRSVVWDGFQAGEGQHEGWSYLGIAGIVGVLVSLCLPAKWPSAPRPLFVAVALMAGYSLSTRVTVANVPVIDYGFVDATLSPITSAFRASGRFMWPCYYLILIWTLAVLSKASAKYGLALISLIVVANAMEVRPVYELVASSLRGGTDLKSSLWRDIGRDYGTLSIVPALIHPWPCLPVDDSPYAVSRFTMLAAQQHMMINSGYLARLDPRGVPQLCRRSESPIESGMVDDRTVYVIRPERRVLFENSTAGTATCGWIDGFVVCVGSDRVTPLLRAISDEN